MASNPAKPPTPKPAGSRSTTAALVPQGVLAGQPDVPLDRPVTTIGSGEQNRLTLSSRTVSRSHALVVRAGAAVYIIDLASRTGVQVNGEPVRDHDLANGDRIALGKFVFRYRPPAIVTPPADPVPAPAAMVICVGQPPIRVKTRAVLIGRRETCDVVLPDDSGASNVHAVLFQVDHNWVLLDLESRAGTAVNGTTITQQVVKFGDRLSIGAATILFQPSSAVEEEPEAVQPEQIEPEPVPVDDAFPLEEITAADDIPLELEEVEPEPLAAEPTPVEVFDPAAASTADMPVELADESTAAVEPAGEEITDTHFGRMVGEFTADNGPLVETDGMGARGVDAETNGHVADAAPASDVDGLSFDLEPADENPLEELPAAAEIEAEPIPAEQTSGEFELVEEAPAAEAEPAPAAATAYEADESLGELEFADELPEPEPATAAPAVETVHTEPVPADEPAVEAASTESPAVIPEPATALSEIAPEPITAAETSPVAAVESAVEPVQEAAPAVVPTAPHSTAAAPVPDFGDLEDFVFVPEAPAAATPVTVADEDVLFFGDEDPDEALAAVGTPKPATDDPPHSPSPPAGPTGGVNETQADEEIRFSDDVGEIPGDSTEPVETDADTNTAEPGSSQYLKAGVVHADAPGPKEPDDTVDSAAVLPATIEEQPDIAVAISEPAIGSETAEPITVTDSALVQDPQDDIGPIMPVVEELPPTHTSDPTALVPEFAESVAHVDEIAPEAAIVVEPDAAFEQPSEISAADDVPEITATIAEGPVGVGDSMTSPTATAEVGPITVADSTHVQDAEDDIGPIMPVVEELSPVHPADPAALVPEFAEAVAHVDEVMPESTILVEPEAAFEQPAEIPAADDVSEITATIADGPDGVEESITPVAVSDVEPITVADSAHEQDAQDDIGPIMPVVEELPPTHPSDTAALATDFSEAVAFVDDLSAFTPSAALAAAMAEAAGLLVSPTATAATEAAPEIAATVAATLIPTTEPHTAPAESEYHATINTDNEHLEPASDEVHPDSVAEPESLNALESLEASAESFGEPPAEISAEAAEPAVEPHGHDELEWLTEHSADDHHEPPSGLIVDAHGDEHPADPAPVANDIAEPVELVDGELQPDDLELEPFIEGDLASSGDHTVGTLEISPADWAVGDVSGVSVTATEHPVEESGGLAVAHFAGIDDTALTEPAAEPGDTGVVDAVGLESLDEPSFELAGDTEVHAGEDDLEFFGPIDSTPEIGVEPATEVQTEVAAPQQPPELAVAPEAAEPTQTPVGGEITATIATDLPKTVQPAPPPSAPRPRGPSLFGFQFDGGSFLGGMPLPLTPAAPVVPGAGVAAGAAAAVVGAAAGAAVTAAGAAAKSIVSPAAGAAVALGFDPSKTKPTGLSAIAQPTISQPTARIAPPAQAAAAAEPAAPIARRPSTPPRPVRAPVGAPGVGPGARSSVVDPLSDRPRQLPRPPLGKANPQRRPEIFSQVETPIGVEVFGGPVVPLKPVDLSAETDDGAVPVAEEVFPNTPARRGNFVKASVLFAVTLALLAGVWFGVNRFVPTSATVVGTITFDGLSRKPKADQDKFREDQKKLLESDEIRVDAQANLESQGKPPGFTGDPAKYAETIDTPGAVASTDDSFQLSVTVPQGQQGIDEVQAVLTAMKARDNGLNDAKQSAVKAAQNAHAAVVLQTRVVEDIRQKRLKAAGEVDEAPRRVAVLNQEQLAKEARQKLEESNISLRTKQALLEEMRRQDPSRPGDPDSDPKVVALRKEVSQLQTQVNALPKKVQAAPGDAVLAGSGDDTIGDQIRTALADKTTELKTRIDELKADALLTPAERERMQQNSVEALNLTLVRLEAEQARAKQDADAVTASAAQMRHQYDSAQDQSLKTEKLMAEEQTEQAKLSQLASVEKDQNTTAAAAVAIPLDSRVAANIDPASISDPRNGIVGVVGGVIMLLMSSVIVSELRRPPVAILESRRAQAVPVTRSRLVAWPQPEQIRALDEPASAEQPGEQFAGPVSERLGERVADF